MTPRSSQRRNPDGRPRRADGAGGGAKPGETLARRSPWRGGLFVAALVVAVFLVYQPAWQGGFLWDDDLHLLNNPVLKPGGLLRAWVPGSYINYWPLTFTVYRLEFALWKLEPLGFHLVNIALHALCAVLAWRVLVELEVPGAMLAAALFALHPVNVESVAWITQLKNLLPLLLALVALLLYLQHDRRGGRWRYAAALAAFWLSTLAKVSLATLPLVMLACAWWRRGRVARGDLLRALPFLAIAVLMTGVEIWSQQAVSAGADVRSDGFLARAAVAGCALWFYLGKLIWPLDLCFVYPRWQMDPARVLSYLPGLALALLLAAAWWKRRSWGRPVVMGIVCYVALLLPVLGFVNIYFMRYSLVADHWQYAATIVPCAAAAAALASWASGRPARRATARAAGLVWLAALAVLTWRQSHLYADIETLWRTTLAKNPECWMAHNNLGIVLAGRGDADAAIDHYHQALRLHPDYADAHNNLGLALARRGEVPQALDHYRKAVEINPDYVAARTNLGNLLARLGQVDAAIGHYEAALRSKPDDVAAHVNLALALESRGQADAAILHYRKAVQDSPDFPVAYNNLGLALARRGELDEAMTLYRRALEIKPDYAEAHNNLALALAGRGQLDDAIAHYQEALKIKPDYLEAHNGLGLALAERDQVEAAIAHYRRALEIDARYAPAYNNLGLAFARLGRLHAAIVQYHEALKISPNFAVAHNNLGLALEALGRFDEAIVHYQKALAVNPGFADARANLAAALAARASAGNAPPEAGDQRRARNTQP